MRKLNYIKKVLLSCQSIEQKESAYNWMNNLYNKDQISRKDFMELIALIENLNFLS